MASSKGPSRSITARPPRRRYTAVIFLRGGERRITSPTLPNLYRRVATEFVRTSLEDVPREADREAIRQGLATGAWEEVVRLYFEDNDREGMEIHPPA